MSQKLILQGLTEQTHAEVLGEVLGGDVERSIISVAFASEDGVNHIEPLLAAHADRVTVFGGIRNEITSAQALKRLLEIGVSLYAVDTGTHTLLFHPKLYYVRKKGTAQLLIGSANLTLGGLNNNIEAGLLLDLSLVDEEEAAFVTELEASFDGLVGNHPENVFQVTHAAAIDALLDAGRLIDETTAPPPRPATKAKAKAGSTDLTPRMKVLPKPLRGKAKAKAAPAPVPVPPLAAGAPAALAPAAAAPGTVPGASATVAPDLELVWESKPLSRRSLGIPSGVTSNPTGSTTLGSGSFDDIDRVTYFRDDLFGHLEWALNGTIETANQEFDLVIKGILLGKFDLTLRHSLTRAAAAAADKNSPTSLSWNEARPLVAREDLLGRTMRIWRTTGVPPEFQVEID